MSIQCKYPTIFSAGQYHLLRLVVVFNSVILPSVAACRGCWRKCHSVVFGDRKNPKFLFFTGSVSFCMMWPHPACHCVYVPHVSLHVTRDRICPLASITLHCRLERIRLSRASLCRLCRIFPVIARDSGVGHEALKLLFVARPHVLFCFFGRDSKTYSALLSKQNAWPVKCMALNWRPYSGNRRRVK